MFPLIELLFLFLFFSCDSIRTCFLIMSPIASAVINYNAFVSLSQEIDLPDKDNYATNISKTDHFDLSDKIFPLAFQNVRPCQ